MFSHHGNIKDHCNGYKIIDCIRCGFTHTDPLPNPAELEKIYRDEYYSDVKPNYFKDYEEDAEWWQLIYSERFENFESNLPSHRRRILDVGSGPGLFLSTGKKRGWETLGIEPSLRAAEYSRKQGLNVRNEFLTPQSPMAELGKFDVVHMSQVLEHIANPKELLSIAHSLLDKDGMICVEVPNDYSPFQLALREVENYKPWWVAAPHHLNYFTPQSLSHLMKEIGFEITKVTSSFPIDLFLLLGDNYIENGTLGRQCHAKRKRLELTLQSAGMGAMKQKWFESMAQLNIGREVVIFARK